MNREASPSPIDFHGDALLGGLLDALEPHASKPLLLEYAERVIQPGYHVTEVKAGAFVTLDCGGNPDRWQETILQVEDLPSQDGCGLCSPANSGRSSITSRGGSPWRRRRA
jgi:hypothetical protein